MGRKRDGLAALVKAEATVQYHLATQREQYAIACIERDGWTKELYWKAAHNEGCRKAVYDIVRSMGEHIGPAPDLPYPTADQSGFRACHDLDDWRQRPDIPKEYEGARRVRTMGRRHPVDEDGKPFEPGTRNDRNANTL